MIKKTTMFFLFFFKKVIIVSEGKTKIYFRFDRTQQLCKALL